eukprot:196375_1
MDCFRYDDTDFIHQMVQESKQLGIIMGLALVTPFIVAIALILWLLWHVPRKLFLRYLGGLTVLMILHAIASIYLAHWYMYVSNHSTFSHDWQIVLNSITDPYQNASIQSCYIEGDGVHDTYFANLSYPTVWNHTRTLYPTNAAQTYLPTVQPVTNHPTNTETDEPSLHPTNMPSLHPSESSIEPTLSPTFSPTNAPTFTPTDDPTFSPTNDPTFNPTNSPTNNPTFSPSQSPTNNPTNPSKSPTIPPSSSPTTLSESPSSAPSLPPTQSPSSSPTDPTQHPSLSPSNPPTTATLPPTNAPSNAPTTVPSPSPTMAPTRSPTRHPVSLDDFPREPLEIHYELWNLMANNRA